MKRSATVALATYATLPDLTPDDQLLVGALRALGVRPLPVVWDDGTAAWDAFDAVVVRSCWDYHLRLDTFLRWIGGLEALGIAVLNPPTVLRWNARKTYLRELAASGIRTVPTHWITAESTLGGTPLPAILDDAGWDDAIVKPVVSASAYGTWRVSRRDADSQAADHHERIRALIARGGAMVQPYLPQFTRDGEWSLVFFEGAFSHAVIKRPAPDDFRVQRWFGGRSERAFPSPAIARQAHAAVGAAPERPVYARVDGVIDGESLLVTELELLEPSLFLDADPAAPDRFASAIVERIRARVRV